MHAHHIGTRGLRVRVRARAAGRAQSPDEMEKKISIQKSHRRPAAAAAAAAAATRLPCISLAFTCPRVRVPREVRGRNRSYSDSDFVRVSASGVWVGAVLYLRVRGCTQVVLGHTGGIHELARPICHNGRCVCATQTADRMLTMETRVLV